MASKLVKIEVAIPVNSELESITKKIALEDLAKNLTTENLLLLADKSKKIGINITIQTFKNLI